MAAAVRPPTGWWQSGFSSRKTRGGNWFGKKDRTEGCEFGDGQWRIFIGAGVASPCPVKLSRISSLDRRQFLPPPAFVRVAERGSRMREISTGRNNYMTNTSKSGKGDSRWSFTPPTDFPDPATCQVRRSQVGENVDCLNAWAWRCPHALQAADGYLCGYSKNVELLGRSAADQRA